MKNNTVLFASLLAFLLIFMPQFLLAQRDWEEMMRDENPNYYEIEKAFNEWWGDRPITDRGYKPAKRWLDRMRGYVNENGIVDRRKEIQYIQEQMRVQRSAKRAGEGTFVGPFNPAGFGIGRIDCIEFHPTQPNILFAGAPSGGLWKSVDYGNNWLPLYEDLSSLGVSDIVIHPTNPDIMYIATGDADHSDAPFIGIMKSLDGGLTFSIVLPPANLNTQVDELVINPDNPDILLAASNQGILRTDDAGATWTTVEPGGFEDIELNPGNPNKAYAVGYGNGSYRHSEDGGLTWSNTVSGLVEPGGIGTPSTNGRMMLSTTAADSNYIYILAAQPASGNFDFKALYQSTDGGMTFTIRSTQNSANLAFAQAWYDLAIKASPIDKNLVYIGDTPFYESRNGGGTWSRRNGNFGPNWLHVDIHDIEFHPFTKDLWVTGDGGVYLGVGGNTAAPWQNRSNGLSVTQFYKLGTSVHNEKTMLAGSQDNGTMFLDNGSWGGFTGGDGMECIVDYSNPNFMVSSSQNGFFYKVRNGNSSRFINSNTTGETGRWVSPIAQDPSNPQTFYAGFQSLWRTTDANTWQNLSGPLGASLSEIVVPRFSGGRFIYAANPSRFFRTTDSGVSWESLNFVDGQGSFYDLEVVDNQPLTIYAAHQYGVYKTVDGGLSWTDISTDLPDLPITSIVHQKGSPEALYAGTPLGIFYTDNTMTGWIPFMENIPNVAISELEISYCAGKIRAATFGRGIWEADLYPNGWEMLASDVTIGPNDGSGNGSATAVATGGFGPYTYVWQTGAKTQTISGVPAGAYVVSITDYNHCVIRDTAYIGTNVSIDAQLTGVSDLTIYPNPVSDQLQIRLIAENAGEISISLYSQVGQLISQKTKRFSPGETHHQLEVASLPAGIYLLDIRQGEERVRTKVVKK